MSQNSNMIYLNGHLLHRQILQDLLVLLYVTPGKFKYIINYENIEYEIIMYNPSDIRISANTKLIC